MKKFYNSKLLFIILFGFLFNVNILFANQVDVTFENGDRYIGEVLNNKKHGSGTYIESGPDGKEYRGEWKNDKQHGKGFLKQSGMEYTGDFFEGKIQGKGVLVDKDGKYEGEFLNGMMHGIGVLKLNDGRIVRGEFKNNKYVGASKKVANPATSMSSDLSNKEKFANKSTINSNQSDNEEKKINAKKSLIKDQTKDSIKSKKLSEKPFIKCVTSLSLSGKEDLDFINVKDAESKCLEKKGMLVEGYFEDNQPMAKRVVHKDKDGDKWILEGEWSGPFTHKDTIFLKGRITTPNSKIVVQEGEFDNLLLIKGRLQFADGSYLEGKFNDNLKLWGLGIKYKNESLFYVGEFAESEPHGQGILKNGSKITSGRFVNGKFADRAINTNFDCNESELSKNIVFLYNKVIKKPNPEKCGNPEEDVMAIIDVTRGMVYGDLEWNKKEGGVNMFDEQEAELSMTCINPQNKTPVTIEKAGNKIWRRVNNGIRALPAEIIESDDTAKKYFAPLNTLSIKIDVVADFKAKNLQQRSAIGGKERWNCY